MSGTKLGSLVGMSQAKISRIERGKGPLSPDDVDAIARALGAGDAETQVLVGRAMRSFDRMTDWRPASSSTALQQKTLADWESSAEHIRIFDPALVPGPLQTSGYAKLVLRAFRRLIVLAEEDQTEEALLSAVSARLRRQQSLADPSRSFKIVMAETALKRRVYPPVEMLAQISHLREIDVSNPNVSIKIVADETPTEIPLLHGFALLDDDLVVTDLYNTGLISRSDRDVETYRRVFGLLEAHATGIGPFLDQYESMYIDMLRKA
jgi:transcriptional regulator with XRE-family HTH domain